MKILYTILIDKALEYLYKGISKLSLFIYDKGTILIVKIKGKKRVKAVAKAKKNNDEDKYNSNIDGL